MSARNPTADPLTQTTSPQVDQQELAYPTLDADVQVAWKCNLNYTIVVWVHQGTARVHFENEVIELHPGQALWIPQRTAHMVEHAADSLALAILIPARHSGPGIGELLRIEVPPGQTGWMFYLMLLTLSPLHRGQLPTARVVEHLTHFIVDIHQTPSASLPPAQHPALDRARRLLEQNPETANTLSAVAAAVGTSERTLRRQITREYSMTFRQFRESCRASHSPAAYQGHWQPVPALSTRWMRFPQHRYALWAYQGRGSVSVMPPSADESQIHTQRLEAGELLVIPDGYSVRLDIDSGALFFPLSMQLDPSEQRTDLRLPIRLPTDSEPELLRWAIAHITALRPPHFNRSDVFGLLEQATHYPGLRWPQEQSLNTIARRLMADTAGKSTLSDMAAEHGLSLRSLQRSWRASTGQTLTAWWTDYRLQRAEGMLRAGFSLPSVARWVGYEHAPNFSRAFLASRGYRPGSVRQSTSFGQRNIY
ncbi:helix-turn-helix domain-containing protein [Glutamicibacter sp.]|uniref:helix-turn-helix domain-containing protein n=1 Tax=Glutamicibacter sp. TaxID=1931995 RepID=UPI002FE14EC3